MNTKEKAKELFEKMYDAIPAHPDGGSIEYDAAKQCALITVDEIIRETKLHDLTIFQHGRTGFWIEVKTEIEKL